MIRHAFDADLDNHLREIIVVSESEGPALFSARDVGARTLVFQGSPSAQWNAAAGISTGDVLLFLRSDTALPDGFSRVLMEAVTGKASAGRFRTRGGMWPLGCKRRSNLFVRRETFAKLGGFPTIGLPFEFEKLVRTLKAQKKPFVVVRANAYSGGKNRRDVGVAPKITLSLLWLMWRIGLSERVLAAMNTDDRPLNRHEETD